MKDNYENCGDARSFQISTPDPFQMARLENSLDLFLEVGMENVEKANKELGQYLYEKLKVHEMIELVSPSKPEDRGVHLCLKFKISDLDLKMFKQLVVELGVFADFRCMEGDYLMRVAPVALYTNKEDCDQLVEALFQALERYSQAKNL